MLHDFSESTKNKLFHLCNQDYKKMKTPFNFFFFLNFINLTMSIQKEKTKKKQNKTKQNKTKQKTKKTRRINRYSCEREQPNSLTALINLHTRIGFI